MNDYQRTLTFSSFQLVFDYHESMQWINTSTLKIQIQSISPFPFDYLPGNVSQITNENDLTCKEMSIKRLESP